MSGRQFFHRLYRKRGSQREGSEFFWATLENGVRCEFVKSPNGRVALLETWGPKGDFNKESFRRWGHEHDEVDILLAAEIEGDVFVRLHETFDIPDAAAPPKIDRDKHIVNGTLVCGWESRNNRSYRPVLRRAAPMYEGAPVSLNHPERGAVPRVEDRFGQIRNPSIDEEFGARGNLHYNPEHPHAKSLLWFMENQPSAICFSHRVNAVGHRNRETGVFEVTDFDRVFGVELVSDGGTTNGMFESGPDDGVEERELDVPASVHFPNTTTETDMDLSKLTVEALVSGRSDLVEKIRESMKAEDEYKALVKERDDLKTENASLKTKIDEHEAASKLAERRDALKKRCLEAAKLPKELVTDTFIETLLKYEESDEDGIKSAIEDRRKLSGKASAPKSKARSASEQAGDDEREATREPGTKEDGSQIETKEFAEGLTA